MQRADPNGGAAPNLPRLYLEQVHVSMFSDQSLDKSAMCLDLARMPITAARLDYSPTMIERASPSTDRARPADPDAGRRRTATQAHINRCDHPVTKIM